MSVTHTTLVTILKRSDGRDQLCGIGSAACELGAWTFTNPAIFPINVPLILGCSAEQASATEAAFTKASKSFGSNRRWLRFALSVYNLPSLQRRLSKFNPRTATIDQWRSQIAQVAGFFSAFGDDISVLGDLSVLPKPIGQFCGRWSCRFWLLGTLLGATKTISEFVNALIKLQHLRARIAASSASSSSSLSSNRSIVNGSILSDNDSLRAARDDVCTSSVDIITGACDIVWASSCSFDNHPYPPAFVAAAALLTQVVGFRRFWRGLRDDAIAAAAAAAAVAATVPPNVVATNR